MRIYDEAFICRYRAAYELPISASLSEVEPAFYRVQLLYGNYSDIIFYFALSSSEFLNTLCVYVRTFDLFPFYWFSCQKAKDMPGCKKKL